MSKKLLILIIVMLTGVPFISIKAQDASNGWIDYCQLLSDAHCQILVTSEAVMDDVNSMVFDMSMDFDIGMIGADIPSSFENINIAIDGTGAIEIESIALDQIYELASIDLLTCYEELPMLMDDVIGGIDGELDFNIALPENLLAEMDDEDIAANIPLHLIMKDGLWSIDIGSLAQAIGEDGLGLSWFGINVNGAFESLSAEADVDCLPFIDEETLDLITKLGNGDWTSGVSITRLPDSNIDGIDVAVFEFNLDYVTFLDILIDEDIISELNRDGWGMSLEEINMAMPFYESIVIAYRQYIGLEDHYSYRYEYMTSMVFDAGEILDEDLPFTMSMDINMSLDLSEFNVPVEVESPRDAMIVPFGMLLDSDL